MTRKSNLLKMLALAWIAGVVLAGCAERPDADEDGSSTDTFTTLSVGKWENGEIVKLKNDETSEQWFKFVATSSTQRVYLKRSTIYRTTAYVYDANYNRIGSDLDNYNDGVKNASYSLKVGETYYIQVSGRGNAGTYWIGFTTTETEPTQ